MVVEWGGGSFQARRRSHGWRFCRRGGGGGGGGGARGGGALKQNPDLVILGGHDGGSDVEIPLFWCLR